MAEKPTRTSGDEVPSEDARTLGASSEDFLRKVARGSARGADFDVHALETELGPDFLGPEAPHFEIRRRLGQGGFGVVYEVFDKRRKDRKSVV